MEVHAHTHTERKKWTHYLWEFLMLFLAVFCGFLAENQREHMVEHQREKQYMRSLIKDLDADIKQTSRLETELHAFLNRLDSIAADLYQSDNQPPSLITCKQLYRGLGFSDFIYTDRTIQQLKNAGGMRLIRNLPVADSIVRYDAMVRRGLLHQDLINTLYLPRTIDQINYSFNITAINNLEDTGDIKADTIDLKKDLFLISGKTELIRLINEIRHYRLMINLQLQFIILDRDLAQNLGSLIKREYHLK